MRELRLAVEQGAPVPMLRSRRRNAARVALAVSDRAQAVAIVLAMYCGNHAICAFWHPQIRKSTRSCYRVAGFAATQVIAMSQATL